MHRVKCVCTNRTHSTYGPFAYYVVYPTIPFIEPSLTIIFNLVHRVERVCTNLTRSPNGSFAYDVVCHSSLYSAIFWLFYGMFWSWWGVCQLPMPLYNQAITWPILWDVVFTLFFNPYFSCLKYLREHQVIWNKQYVTFSFSYPGEMLKNALF